MSTPPEINLERIVLNPGEVLVIKTDADIDINYACFKAVFPHNKILILPKDSELVTIQQSGTGTLKERLADIPTVIQ